MGFVNSKADNSRFVKHISLDMLVFVVYMDDIFITCSSFILVEKLIADPHLQFAIKDLGILSYFLDLELSYGPKCIYRSQHNYIKDLLEAFGIKDAKPLRLL